MYLNALEFLEEEREAWRPYEALDSLTDEQLDTPIDEAHDWSGRDLIGHLVAWQSNALDVAKEHILAAAQPNFLYTLENRYVDTLQGKDLQHNNPVATAVKHGVFVTFENGVEDIRRNLASFGWHVAAWEAAGQWQFVDASPDAELRNLTELADWLA